MSGLVNSIGESFRLAKTSFKEGTSSFRNSKKFELEHNKSISAGGLGVDSNTVYGKFLDSMGSTINLPTRLLESSDEFFKSMSYRAEVHAQAHRKAARQQIAESLSDEETAKLVKKFIENPDESIQYEALSKARENTFTKPLEELALRGFEAKDIDSAIRSSMPLRIVAPFTKTNLNLVEYALNRTPLAKGLLGDIKAGGLRKDTALARVSLGMGTMAMSAGLATQGKITGRGPVDREARKALEATGWKPYSIKVGDKYVSYDRMDSFGSLLGIAADSAELVGALEREREGEATQLAVQAGSVLAQFFTPEFITRNMNDFIDAINGDERKLENFLSGVARGTIPFSSFARSIRSQVDPISRDRRADPEAPYPVFERILNELRDTLPGMSDNLPPRRNVFGEAISFVSFRDNPDDISPLAGKNNSDPIAKEIQRLNMTGPSLIEDDEGLEYLKIDMPDKHIRKGSGGQSVTVKLNPEQYDRLVTLSAG